MREGVCSNCVSAPERKRQGEEILTRRRADFREWVERFTRVAPGEAHAAALLRALFGEEDEILVRIDAEMVIVNDGEVERALAVPSVVAMNLSAFLEHRAAGAGDRSDDRIVEVTVFAFEDGEPVSEGDELVVERHPVGYRVRWRL